MASEPSGVARFSHLNPLVCLDCRRERELPSPAEKNVPALRAGSYKTSSRNRSSVRGLVNLCWWFFRWGIALVLIAALIAGGYLYFQLDEEIRRYAETTLATHYRHLDVRVGSARFVPGQGVSVFNIEFSEPDQPALTAAPSPTAGASILHIGELSLVGAFELRQLIDGRPAVDEVVVRRAELTAQRQLDGSWSVSKLLPRPVFGEGPPPPLRVRGASLVLSDAASPTAAPLAINNIDFLLEHGSPHGAAHLEGEATAGVAKRFVVTADLNDHTGELSATVELDRLRLDDQLLAFVAKADRTQWQGLKAKALASGRLTLARESHASPWSWDGAVRLSEGVLQHAALPRPVTDLQATVSFNNKTLAVRDLSAKLGVAEVHAALNRYGWRENATMTCRARAVGLVLDDKVRAALPSQLKKLWRRFRPSGMVNVTASATFDGQRWKPEATFDCQGLAVEDSERFPYRMTGARGEARFSGTGPDNQATFAFNLQGLAEGQPVAIAADFHGLPCPGRPTTPRAARPLPPCPLGWVEVTAPRLRVSKSMLAALRPHPHADRIAQALSPSGEFGLRWRMERKRPEQRQPSIEVDLQAIDCRIQYDRFPYSLDHIRGELKGRDNVWTFQGLECREVNGPRVVTASGRLAPENGQPVFRMRLSAVGVPLDEELHRALPTREQQVWTRLNPRGRVSLTTDVAYRAGEAAPRIDLAVAPYDRSVSLEPDFFRYRLDRLDGRFVLRNGQLSFANARAEHGRTRISSSGDWQVLPSGGWQFQLTNLSVDYLDADHDLRLAAPLALRRVIDEIQPEGAFGLHDGRLVFTYDPAIPNDLRTDWDVQLDCHQADVTFGSRVQGVSGGVRLAGASNSAGCQAYGELRLDSLFWNGLQLTNVRGPLWADAGECLLGEGVAAKLSSPSPARITANAYGGAVSINTRVLQQERARYSMAIQLEEIDLARLSTDYLNSATPLTGTAKGQLTLSGQGSSIYGLEGTGAIQVSDANLYELPVAVAMLKVLSNRSPDTTAFDGANAEFTMQGKHLHFSRLDLEGDAVSLYGRGEASLDKDLNLTFHTIVGRSTPAVPLLRSLVGQASEQILRLRVLGSVDQPEIRREALPVVGNVLEQLRADLQPRPLSQPVAYPQAAALRRQTKLR